MGPTKTTGVSAASLQWADVIRRSAYTILVLTLTATAVLTTVVGGRVGMFVSLTCAAVGVIICGIAWSSPTWRTGAGPVRHGLVTIAGVACTGLIIIDIVQMLSASRS